MSENIYVLYGYPLKSSLSPKIHNNSLKNCSYFKQAVKPINLKFAIRVIRKFAWKGANITIPHKINVIKYLDEIDDSAKTIGAVNTINNIDGKLIGHNTDVIGFKESLPLLSSKNRAIIIGAGGASRAVILALIEMGFREIHIYNRTLQKAKHLKEFFFNIFPKVCFKTFSLDKVHLIQTGDILVNCTPLNNPIPKKHIHKIKNFECIYDLKYKKDIELLTFAKKYGVKHVSNGLDMLILQAAYAQKIWTNTFPNVKKIKDSLK